MNREQGVKAKRKKLEPYLICAEEQIDSMPPFPFPSVGDAADDFDDQYDRIESLFCDSTGFDNVGPALSVDGLKRRLRKLLNEHGDILCAIEEVGQFQLCLGVWKEKNDQEQV